MGIRCPSPSARTLEGLDLLDAYVEEQRATGEPVRPTVAPDGSR